MSDQTKWTEAATARAEALQAYRACKTDAERAALYHATPILREIISIAMHPTKTNSPESKV